MSLSRKLLVAMRGDRKYKYPKVGCSVDDGAAVHDLICNMLWAEAPCMICRLL